MNIFSRFKNWIYPKPALPDEIIKIHTTCLEHTKFMVRLARIEGENIIILTMLTVILYYLIVR